VKVEADYIVVLNSDTEVLNSSWVERLLDVARKDPKVVAVACKMVSMDDHSRLDSVGWMGIPFWRSFVDIGREEHDRGQYDHEGFEPFAFCGGAALIKRDIFMRLGGLMEGSSYTLRMWIFLGGLGFWVTELASCLRAG